MSFKPDAHITTLRGVGPQTAQRLNRLGINTVFDVLLHLPVRYENRTCVVPIGDLKADIPQLIQGRVEQTTIEYRRTRTMVVDVSDDTGRLRLKFFRFTQGQQNGLSVGVILRCFGEAHRFGSRLEMIHPEITVLTPSTVPELENVLTAVYPSTEGLKQKTLRSIVNAALSALDGNDSLSSVELLSEDILAAVGLPDLANSLRLLHRPSLDIPAGSLLDDSHPGRRRLAFEELLALRCALQQMRRSFRKNRSICLTGKMQLHQEFLRRLPFRLTDAQHHAVNEIITDLRRELPMLRLLQGDVGTGKTLVAACAAINVIDEGHQVAFIAPTELLAEQHHRTFAGWFEPLNIEICFLTGRMAESTRRRVLKQIASSTKGLILGTHALLQENIKFANLGLVVIDEQHRFGVQQRLSLLQQGIERHRVPHQLVMTATPIPQTLALTMHADLDISILNERPPDRCPVRTTVLPQSRREQLLEKIAALCRTGRQAFWVCTLIEDSETLQCEAAEAVAQWISNALPDIKTALLHGRLPAAEKDKIMQAFSEHQLDLLVTTTVVEVGVDVPNASLLVVENAERLGLAQLHQLRGRVGRGTIQSDCVLLYSPPLRESARARLAAMRDTQDGFEIAERDLRIRGPGELLGTRQAGLPKLRIANLARDASLITTTSDVAEKLLAGSPETVDTLVRRWFPDFNAA